MRNGVFITLEGGEGSGKSTQIRKLATFLTAQGKEVVLTREPGGSDGAEEIRSLLLKGGADRWDFVSEMLLFSAARRDHLVKKIWPALAEGKWVISDRFADSTLAYQGYGYGFSQEKKEMLDRLYQMIAGRFEPDLTFFLDMDPVVGLKRSLDRPDNSEKRFEEMDVLFHQRLRDGFLKIATDCPARCAVIQADQTPQAVHEDMIRVLKERGFL